MRITPQLEGDKFFVRQNGLLWATPLFLVLILVEASDVIFAVDSIPAIFAVTSDPFIVLTANLMAILGLRAMFFYLLALRLNCITCHTAVLSYCSLVQNVIA